MFDRKYHRGWRWPLATVPLHICQSHSCWTKSTPLIIISAKLAQCFEDKDRWNRCSSLLFIVLLITYLFWHFLVLAYFFSNDLIFAFSSWMVWQISPVVSFHSDLGICNRGRKTFLRKFLLSFSLWDTAAAAAWFFVVNLLKEAASSSACRTIEHPHFKRKQVGLLWNVINTFKYFVFHKGAVFWLFLPIFSIKKKRCSPNFLY